MDEMIELILEILFKPFEAIYERTFERIKHIPHKGLRIFVRIILIAIPGPWRWVCIGCSVDCFRTIEYRKIPRRMSVGGYCF